MNQPIWNVDGVMTILGMHFLDKKFAPMELCIGFLTLRVRQLINDQESIAVQIILHFGFGQANIVVKCGGCFGLEFRRAGRNSMEPRENGNKEKNLWKQKVEAICVIARF